MMFLDIRHEISDEIGDNPAFCDVSITTCLSAGEELCCMLIELTGHNFGNVTCKDRYAIVELSEKRGA